MIRHYTVVVPNTPTARATVYGSQEEVTHYGPMAVAPAAAAPIAAGRWGAPTQNSGLTQCAWGVWATQDACSCLLSKLPALVASVAGAQFFVWEDTTETQAAYVARWKAATTWVDLALGSAGTPILAAAVL